MFQKGRRVQINNSGTNLIVSSKKLLLLIVIAALSFLFRENKISLTYGVNFSLASLFTFVILRYYGLLAASSIIMLINIIDWFFYDGNFYTIFLFTEVLVVGALWKKKHYNLFLIDVFYWLLLGAPLTCLVFYFKNGFLDVEGMLLLTNICINGLVNVLLADIVLSYIPIYKIFGQKQNSLLDLNKMIFHLTVTAVLAPFLAFTMVDAWVSQNNLESDIYQKLRASGLNISGRLQPWEKNDLRKLRLKSPIYLKNFKTILKSNPFYNSVEVSLVDSKHNLFLVNDETKYDELYNWRSGGEYIEIFENTYKWSPSCNDITFDLSHWKKSFYITIIPLEDIDLYVQIKLPLSQYTDNIWRTYLDKFLILFFFFLISTIISIMTSRFVSKDLLKLNESSRGLPDKLKSQDAIKWPKTSIYQVNSLLSNFQAMWDKLTYLFDEANNMNNQLLSQTKELEASREKMKDLAYKDALTGLPNRLSFTGYLEEQLNSPDCKSIAIMFIDLNRFKQINDTLGHEIGDILIQEVANKLITFHKKGSFVARLGGDEFVVVLENTDKKGATKVALNINKILSEPVNITQKENVNELYIAGCIGISMYPSDAREKSTLLKYADLAMYAAKETGDNTFRFYSELAESNIADKLQLEQSLCKALERNEILIYYQPKINVHTGKITGMEALIRWNHSQRGLVSPGQFIPLAEETGIINPIGEWVLIEACKQNKAWQDMGYPKMRISVNLSPRQFYGNNIITIVSKALDISGMEPEYLELEITEGLLMKNTKYVISVLQELREMGVYISIDDFGIGYSSFSRLKELPVQIIKIDKSFITDIAKEKINSSIVAAIIQLAHSMNLKVVAEGVETIEEFKILESMNCNEIQGYLFSKPIPAIEFQKFVSNFKITTHI